MSIDPSLPLAEALAAAITMAGPLSIAQFMGAANAHYYASRDPLGTEGDFVTAPEISQMFGEMIGLCLAQIWLDQGAPSKFVLAELGPGRGTMMADILRATAGVSGFGEAAQIVLLEASEALRTQQAKALQGYDVAWVASISDLPDLPLLAVANEFFDALPIRQFVRAAEGWSEVVVGVSGDALVAGRAGAVPIDALEHRLFDTAIDDVVELCSAAQPVIGHLATQVAQRGGAAIVIDYGGARSDGDTFQAVRGHRPEDPFASPGLADITAHVDFGALGIAAQGAARGIRVSGMTPQGVLLERLGITPRAQALAKGMVAEPLENHISAHRRLTHPDEMGTLFKAIALTPRGTPPPPGFDP